jgi:FkbM family methyltransferase
MNKFPRYIKVLLSSRKIFKNWLSVGITYYLAKKGVLRIKMVSASCTDGSNVLLPLKLYSSIVNLHHDGFIESTDFSRKVANVKCLGEVPLEELEGVDSATLTYAKEWRYVSGFWQYKNLIFKHLRLGLVEVFCLNPYPLEDVSLANREVVDVGAYVGDSVIYFLSKGASRVIALEPHPKAFEEMLVNLKFNNMLEKVVALNVALGCSRRKVRVPSRMNMNEIWSFNAISSEGDTEVEVLTLREILSNVEDPYLIKLDCEGCEYEVVSKFYDELRKFEVVFIEYHSGYDQIIRTMSKDYEYQVIENPLFKNPEKQGIIKFKKRA